MKRLQGFNVSTLIDKYNNWKHKEKQLQKASVLEKIKLLYCWIYNHEITFEEFLYMIREYIKPMK
jgi:hypothetical protein